MAATPQYRVVLLRRAQKQMKRLEPRAANAAGDAIASLAFNPRPDGVRKLKGERSGYRIVVKGDYRVLYDVDDEQAVVTITSVSSRQDAYK